MEETGQKHTDITYKFTNDVCEIEYLDHMGSDASIVRAARVSFNKDNINEDAKELTDKDIKLINYLSKHKHWSPFAHTCISLRCSVPLFVARQLVKHKVGGVLGDIDQEIDAFNEVSRRYTRDEFEFYIPKANEWRLSTTNIKQGSSKNCLNNIEGTSASAVAHSVSLDAMSYYMKLLNNYNVAPEQLRMLLPQNMMVKFIWTGSLFYFFNMCKLRLDTHAQKETRVVAERVAEIVHKLFPVSFMSLITTYGTGD